MQHPCSCNAAAMQHPCSCNTALGDSRAKPWGLQCSRAFGLEAARHPGASQTRFWHGRYCKNRLLMEIVFNAFGDWFLLFCESFGSYFIDYWFEISMFEASQTRFWHGRYCKNQFLMEIVYNATWDLFLLVFQKPWELVLSITDSKFRSSGLPKRGSGMESIAKISFWWKSFLMQFGICFCCFFKSLGS